MLYVGKKGGLSSFDSALFCRLGTATERAAKGLLQPSSGQPNEGQGSRDRIRGGYDAMEEKG